MFNALLLSVQTADHEVLMKYHHSLQNLLEDQVCKYNYNGSMYYYNYYLY